jgi:hypothetical protein
MRKLIRERFGQMAGELGGIEKGHFTNDTTYSTYTFDERRAEVQITGMNIILVLKGSKPYKDDEPLMIMANYDSDENGNVVDDNGSGIAALLVVGDYFAKQVKDEKLKLEHTVIFAATDTSIRKYNWNSNGAPTNATTGADRLVQEFLPEFMRERKSFRGAIVLDSLLNYNDAPRSQIIKDGGYDKSYPEAYIEMAKDEFAGNFLALLARDSELDKGLTGKIQEGWKRGLNQPKTQGGNGVDPSSSQINPKLITFIKKAGNPVGDGEIEFLKSDQNSVWSHHERPGMPQYPAILLTDTRVFRSQMCGHACDYLAESTKPKNLAFIHRTMMAIHYVLREQTDSAIGGAPSVQGSTMLMVIPLLALSFRYVAAINT